MKITLGIISLYLAGLTAAQKPTSSQCCADTGVCNVATYDYQIPILDLSERASDRPIIDGRINRFGDNIGDSPPVIGWVGTEYSNFLELPMYIGGRNGGNDRVGTAFLAYDCTNRIVCAAAHLDENYLLAQPTISVQQDDDESFIRFGQNNGAGRIRQSNSDEFAYIGTPQDSTFIIGYEGCWSVDTIDRLESITNNFLEIHFSTSGGDTVSTGRPAANGDFVCLTPDCLTEPPTSAPNNIPPIGLLTPKPTGHPSASPSQTPSTQSPSASPSQAPSTQSPTFSPSQAPSTQNPSSSPSQAPSTQTPSASPSQAPSTQTPSTSPSQAPSTQNPTSSPSQDPSVSPSTSPTVRPTRSPILGTESPSVSVSPSAQPSEVPSPAPSTSPSSAPSLSPSQSPSTQNPSTSPSQSPVVVTDSPSVSPSLSPSTAPSSAPSTSPVVATDSPSSSPTSSPTPQPTSSPIVGTEAPSVSVSPSTPLPSTDAPSTSPTSSPSAAPTTTAPTSRPSNSPVVATNSPSTSPSSSPTSSPTRSPIVGTEAPTVSSSPSTPMPSTDAPSTGAPITNSPTTASPTSQPTSSPIVNTEAPSISISPSTSMPSTDAPSTTSPTATSAPSRLGSGFFIPNCFTGSGGPSVCIIDDGTYELPAVTPKYNTEEECCSGFYAWTYDSCMGNGPSGQYFPNWQDVNIGEGNVCLLDDGNHNVTKGTPRYDDLSDCCDDHYSWNLAECNGSNGGGNRRPVNLVYYPNWGSSPNVCLLADEIFVPQGVPVYNNLAECCSNNYSWNSDECNGVQGGSSKYYPNWNLLQPTRGSSPHVCLEDDGSQQVPAGAPLFDDLDSCCNSQYSWNLVACLNA